MVSATTYHDRGLATPLRAADLPRHRGLPDGWRATMGLVRAHGGPWRCPNGHASLLEYRCSICERDLAGETG